MCCLQESDALQGEVKLLQNERSRLAREVSLKQQLEEGWAQRAGQQAAALKEAQTRISTLEKSLQQVTGPVNGSSCLLQHAVQMC